MPVREVEVALDPGFVVVRAAEVAPYRHPEGVGAVAGRAEGPAEARVGPVGDHDVAGSDLLVGSVGVAVQDRPGDQATVDDRLDGLGAGLEHGAGLHRPVGDHGVEVAAANDVPVGREVWVLGPAQLEGDAVGDRAQAFEAEVRFELVGQAEIFELADRSRRQPVPARLFPWKLLALDDEDSVAGAGEPRGAGRAGRARADDEHVESVETGHRGHRAIGAAGTFTRAAPDMELPQLAW